ncbi:MAG TPA: PKD domain-containing protein [Candidatus Eisenbacteria bacterium]|nr:PKD domain-containing protein [Candidatus Eisenbacteria bacterium]
MFRSSATAAWLAAVVSLAVVAHPVQAQFMFLDANGDGVHDASDVLPASGLATVEVWIVTNANRDGSPAACASDPASALTINSYEVILRAEGGTVAYGALQNLMTDWSTSFGHAGDEVEFYAGFGGASIETPGTYRLGRVTIEALSGSPRIVIAPSTRLVPAGQTSFGSLCPGADNDNTMKLGQEWSDADGLAAAGVTSEPPVFARAYGVSMFEGEQVFRTITATDADSDSLGLALTQAPGYASLTVTSSDQGRVEGRLALAPSYADAGAEEIRIVCSDGTLATTIGLGVVVRDLNPAPTFDPIEPIAVALGTVGERAVTARDPDLQPLEIALRSAPPFVTLGPTEPVAGAYRAIATIAPGPSDGGSWDVALEVTDQTSSAVEHLIVYAYDPDNLHAPTLDSIPDFALAEGDTVTHLITSLDVDGNYIALALPDSPPFVALESEPWRWAPEPGLTRRMLTIAPGPHDAGDWQATVVAADDLVGLPAVQTAKSFRISVANRPFPPQAHSKPERPCVEKGEVYTVLLSVSDPDDDPFTATFGPPPAWGTATVESPTSCRYVLSPTSDDPAQEFGLSVHTVDASGATADLVVPLTLADVWNCPRGSGSTESPVFDSLAAVVVGPTHGVAGSRLRFEGNGKVHPADAILRFEWNFGDGTSGLGKVLAHEYREGGTYRAILATTVPLAPNYVARDTATVTVLDALPARALLSPDETPIVLRSGRPLTTIRMERVGDEYSLADLAPASLCLWSPGHGSVDSIFAQVSSGLRVEDRDRNGVPELAIPFAKEDLRRLFANVRGKQTVSARLQGRLSDGSRVRGTFEIEILGAPAKGASAWPNPMNPRGMIAFEAKRPGNATVRLYDVSGRLVRTLLDGRVETGEVRVPIDGFDARGRALSSGIYFYQVTTLDGTWRGRATILK